MLEITKSSSDAAIFNRAKWSLIGQWQVCAIEINSLETGCWEVFRGYWSQELTWEFLENKESIIFNGTLIERLDKEIKSVSSIYYDQSEGLLYIDRSSYDRDGFCSFCLSDNYRIEFSSESELWLCDFSEESRIVFRKVIEME